MNLTEYAKTRGDVDVDPQALDELLGIQLPGRWKPQFGETYWYIDDCGMIRSANWRDILADEYRYKMRNVFRTEADAEFERDRCEVIAELENYAEEHNEYTLDWKNGEQQKWRIQYNYECEYLNVRCAMASKSLTDTYFTSEEIAQDAIDAVGVYRIKKYVCKVVD